MGEEMNETQQTLGLIGQPTAQMREELIKAQSSPDASLAKSVASNRNFGANSLGPLSPLSDATLKALEALGLTEFADMAKSITTGTGLVAYDLQAPAKNLYPFYAPIRNFLPRVGGGVGTATNWRQVNAIIGSGFDNIAWVPEGQRSGRMQYNTSNRSASYVTIGEEDAITYEAINAARTFEDLQATMVFRLLQKMMLKEEIALLGGNATMALGTPTTPSLSTTGSATGVTLPSATYYVQVAALTIEGWNNAVRTAPMSAPTSLTVTGADSQTYTVNGGTGPISALSAGQASGGNGLVATTPYVPGAVGYAWYVGTTNSAGTGRLQAITTTNTLTLTTALNATAQLASALTADFSSNPNYGFDGLLTTALKPGSGAIITTMAGTLTPSFRGSVAEIDTLFRQMWDTYQLSPTVMFVNSQELTNITTKVLQGGSGGSPAPLLRYDTPADGGDYRNFTAGGIINQYYNPYAPPDAGMMIPVRIHPKVPPGTIVCWAQNLPVQYQSNEVPNVAEVKTRQDYYQIDWPIVTRQRAVGVYAEEVLAVYA